MLNYRTLAVLKREIKAQIFSKAFILMTVLMPILMFGAYGVMFFVMTFDKDKVSHVEIVSSDSHLLEKVKLEAERSKSKVLKLTYEEIKSKEIDDYVNAKRKLLLGDSLTGIVFISDSSLAKKKIKYYSSNPKDVFLQGKLKSAVNTVFIKEYFKENDLNEEQISYIKQSVDLTPIVVSEDKTEEDSGKAKFIIAFIFSFLLYLSVMLIGMAAMRSATEEKINRVVEVLLSSVSSRELMKGKILASAITGLTQMGIWILPMAAIGLTSLIALPVDFQLDLSFADLLYFFTNYLIGLVTFISLFAAVGSIFDNDQDAQQGVMPLMMLVMIPFYVAISLLMNPANSIGEIASLIPFFSIIVMPVRMTLIEVPTWQLFVQLGINLVVMYGAIIMAGKIYRVGILLTGKKPKWSEVFQWIKAS